jgi:hypothetical protein
MEEQATLEFVLYFDVDLPHKLKIASQYRIWAEFF